MQGDVGDLLQPVDRLVDLLDVASASAGLGRLVDLRLDDVVRGQAPAIEIGPARTDWRRYPEMKGSRREIADQGGRVRAFRGVGARGKAAPANQRCEDGALPVRNPAV
jgi:hypothetical protein